MESVQKFFNTNQYKILGLLFFAGVFYAESIFKDKALEIYKIGVSEEIKDLESEIIELKGVIDYNSERVGRQIKNSETETQLRVDNKILKLKLENYKRK